MSPTVEWLRARSDSEIAELLTARPDVMLPAPADLSVIARRLDTGASVRRAVVACTAFELQVLQAMWVLCGPGSDGTTPAAVAALLGGPATAADVTDAITRLHRRALVRLVGAHYVLGPTTGDALGRFPGGLAPVTAVDDPTLDVAAELASITDAARGLLTKLVPGPPVGSVPEDSPHRPLVDELIAQGLLVAQQDGTVLLPQRVSLALRGPQPFGPAEPTAPDLVTTARPTGTVDGAAAGQALAARYICVQILDRLGEAGLPALKSGGVGSVPTKQLARDVGIDLPTCALYLEVLYASGLIAPAIVRDPSAAPGRRGRAATETTHWVPTQTADTFLGGGEAGGWALIASTWLDMRRDAARVGERDDAGKPINALAAAATWRRGPAERHRVLSEIADLPADLTPDLASVVARMRFAAPLANPDALGALATAVLAEATELGITAFGALSTAGRAIVDGDIEGAAEALEVALPRPVDTVLLQADMTIIAPGRLEPRLAEALAEIADVESAGAATVYRLSEGSIRRALDLGATRTEIHELLVTHSKDPVPQSVSYLIDDVARRHGTLRVGMAQAIVHSDDPALVRTAVAAAAAAGLPIRAIADTVAVSPVEVESLMETLRAAGLAPAAEDEHGVVVTLRPAPLRTRVAMPTTQHYAEPSPPSPQQIAAVVARMRAGDRDARRSDPATTGHARPGRRAARADQDDADQTGSESGGAVSDPADVLALLRDAARRHTGAWIHYADTEGAVTKRAVDPLTVSGGMMVAFDRLRNTPRTFALARIHSASAD